MSAEYDLYLNEHKMNVMRAFDWIAKNNIISDDDPDSIPFYTKYTGLSIKDHDKSKYSDDEYYAYDAYFYGDRKDCTEKNFNRAWLHHIHNNPHHWQHWVLINDDPELGSVALEMDYGYVIEMICDWWAFSWKTGNLFEIFNWYDAHKDYMILHENTRKLVEDILDKIREKLEKEK